MLCVFGWELKQDIFTARSDIKMKSHTIILKKKTVLKEKPKNGKNSWCKKEDSNGIKLPAYKFPNTFACWYGFNVIYTLHKEGISVLMLDPLLNKSSCTMYQYLSISLNSSRKSKHDVGKEIGGK